MSKRKEKMWVIYALAVIAFLAPQFACPVYPIELCEPQDYYNLAGSTKCTLEDKKAGDSSDSRQLMFEILKNYPYENKDKFIQVLQRKIELVDDYLARHKGAAQTDQTKVNVSMLEQARRSLEEQLKLVGAATPDTWVSVRDEARAVLADTAQRLRDVQ